MAFGVIDLIQVGVVSDGFDALLRGNDLIVASHDGDGAKFETFCQMHGADRSAAGGGLDVLAEDFELEIRQLGRFGGARDLRLRTDEDADLMRRGALF